jgi:HPt (histidine-containing phosphotransfer) domain-containing protein
MIDKEAFKENFKYYDNEVIVQIMDIFFSEYVGNLELIQKSIVEKDFATLNQKAHGLKGVVAYMSENLSNLCLELETKGKDNNDIGLQPVYDQLKQGILELVEDLKSLRREYAV